MIPFATASHNLIRDQKSPQRGSPRTPSECLTSLSEPVKQVCEAASSTPFLPLSSLQQRFKPPAATDTPRATLHGADLSPPTRPLAGRHLLPVISFATAFHNLIRDQESPERAPPGTPPESLAEPVKQVCEAASRTPCLPLSDLQQRFKLSDLPQRFQHALGCLLWRAPPSTGGVGGYV